MSKEIWTLVVRKFPSTNHAEYWKDYEKLLIYRSLFASASRILHSIFAMIAGSAVWQISGEYLTKENNELEDADLATKYHTVCKATHITLEVGRVIFIVICCKWQKLTKLTLYYEMLFILVDGLMPYEIH